MRSKEAVRKHTMSNDPIRPHTFFAVLGGGALLVHVLAVIRLLFDAITSGGRVDEERFVASFFVTIALLGVGLLFLRFSRHKQLSDFIYSSIGTAYSLLGILFFPLARTTAHCRTLGVRSGATVLQGLLLQVCFLALQLVASSSWLEGKGQNTDGSSIYLR